MALKWAEHLIQFVVDGIIEGVSVGSPSLESEHLLLLLIQQRLHVLNHDAVAELIGLQKHFDSLDAGKGHSNIDEGAGLGRAPPEVQLQKTRALLSLQVVYTAG